MSAASATLNFGSSGRRTGSVRPVTTVCMVALEGGGVLAGSDTWSGALGSGQSAKLLTSLHRQVLVGLAGEALLKSLMAETLAFAPEEEGQESLESLRGLVGAWARSVAAHPLGAATMDSEGVIDGSGALGSPDGVFFMDGLANVVPVPRGYLAVGSGGEVASGALHVLLGSSPQPPAAAVARDAVLRSLRAAAAFDAFTRPPFDLHLLSDGQLDVRRQES